MLPNLSRCALTHHQRTTLSYGCEQDADDAKANEAIRRKAGKDQAQAQADLKLKQAQKDAEERKRDKQLELDARNRVKAQIEADKKARAEKAARDKA